MTDKKHGKHVRIQKYTIPFADELPDTGFKTTWVDWSKIQATCFVMRKAKNSEELAVKLYARISDFVSFNFVDAGDNIDAEAAQVLSAPHNIQKSYFSVNFDINVKDKKKAKDILKRDKNTIFRLKAIIKAARTVAESMAVAMVAPPGLGGIFSRQVSATGRVNMELEFPRPVIWCETSEALKDDGKTQKITVDTVKINDDTSEPYEEFVVNLMEYDADAQVYKPKDPPPVFNVKWEQDEDSQWLKVNPDKVSVSNAIRVSVSNANRVRVVPHRLILGNKISDTESVENKKIGRILISLANPPEDGPKPINEKHAVTVFYKPIEKAKAHILTRKKSCFFCGDACTEALPEPKAEVSLYIKAECGQCKINTPDEKTYFDEFDDREINGEDFGGIHCESDDMKAFLDVYWRMEFGSKELNEWAEKSGFITKWEPLK